MYWKLKDKKPIPVCNTIEWAQSFDSADRVIARTEIGKDVVVSTVFLGLDHSFGKGAPLLFETMIFGGPHDEYQERYSTFEEAEKGHDEAVKLAKRKLLREV